ncbi:MAG: hypothetical protein ABJG68_11675 [Crocinitomicaceae bacterium]
MKKAFPYIMLAIAAGSIIFLMGSITTKDTQGIGLMHPKHVISASLFIICFTIGGSKLLK